MPTEVRTVSRARALGVLDGDQIRSILSLYHLDDLEDFGGVARSRAHAAYWVRVRGRRYFLRITEKKRMTDMLREKELLLHLRSEGLPVPELIQNVARGTFIPWASDGSFVSLFHDMPGREIGLFEVRARHVRAVAEFAARLHVACDRFAVLGENAPRSPSLEPGLGRLRRALRAPRFAQLFDDDLALLERESMRQRLRDVDTLPHGLIHGELAIENVKFVRDALACVGDFDASHRERFTWEIACLVNAWCWVPSAEQTGGPAGAFKRQRVRSLVSAYRAVRPLSEPERRALPHDLRLVAARTAMRRMLEHEVDGSSAGEVPYVDYRHHMARLRALCDGGAEDLVRAAFA